MYAGIDFDTNAVHVVLLPEVAPPRYLPFVLEGHDAFERTRQIREVMPPRGWWEDEGVVAIAIDELRHEGLVHHAADHVVEAGAALQVRDVGHRAGRQIVDDKHGLLIADPHDLDAFACLLGRERRPRWFRALARHTLAGLQKAAVVFHLTMDVRRQIERHGLLDPARLVHAAPGVAPEFTAEAEGPTPCAESPYLLHVGSCIPRKRVDVLLDVEVECDLRAAGRSDRIGQTIHYKRIYEVVEDVAANQEHKLVEALGQRIAEAILGKFDADAVTVTVRKPKPISGVLEHAGIRIRRTRDGL